MSPRFKRPRKVLSPPIIKGLKPYGLDNPEHNTDPVSLLFEEYEAMRLCDYDLYNHHQSSVIMNISRPTFTRIYASARQKITKALVEGRQIIIEGGKVYFDSTWYECIKCDAYFNNPERESEIIVCPLCGNPDTHSVDNSVSEVQAISYGDFCLCPECGFETEHSPGNPCNQQFCPKCKTRLRRKK